MRFILVQTRSPTIWAAGPIREEKKAVRNESPLRWVPILLKWVYIVRLRLKVRIICRLRITLLTRVARLFWLAVRWWNTVKACPVTKAVTSRDRGASVIIIKAT